MNDCLLIYSSMCHDNLTHWLIYHSTTQTTVHVNLKLGAGVPFMMSVSNKIGFLEMGCISKGVK